MNIIRPLRYGTMLRTYLTPLRWRVAALALSLVTNIGLQLYIPRILRTFIDTAQAGGQLGALVTLASLFLAVALCNQGVAVLAAYFSQDVGWRATNQLRSDLTLHCLRQDIAFHKAHTPGELIERIDGDVSTLANFFAQFVVLILSNAIFLVGTLVVLCAVDWRVGMTLALFVAVSLLTLLRIRNIATPHWQAVRQRSAEFLGFLGERLGGREDIRGNGAEPHVMRLFLGHMRRRLESEEQAGLATATMLIASFGLLAVGMSAAFAVGALLVRAAVISIGTAYMILFYTEQLRRPIEQIVAQVQDLGRASASIRRIQALLDAQITIRDGSAELPPGPLAVEFTSVQFDYEPGAPLLRDLSFHLKPGQVLGIIGRTGSGKTTVTRLLARLYEPQGGVIRLGGMALSAARLATLRCRVAVVTQDVQLFAGTVRENLTLFDPAIADDRALDALRALGLWEWFQSLPQGLDTEMRPGGGGLSAGEAQLMAFTRAFLKDPGLVILDEASSRLDPATEQRIERVLDRLLQNRTVIVVAHRLATVRRADTILVLEGGRVLEAGPRADLAADAATHFHRLLKSGLGEVRS